MRRDVTFQSRGLRCRGWLYTPDSLGPGRKAPAVVMANGFSATKEMALPRFAERFAAAGLATLVFDYRFFGESDGQPRNQILPLEMVEDYRNAITWVSDLPEVDSGRVGVWGTSLSGGLVLYVGTYDKRVKAVVAQVPSALNYESRRAMNPTSFDAANALLLNDRVARYKTGAVNYIKVVAPDAEPCALPGKAPYDAVMALAEGAPNWRNQVTLESLEKIREFDPVSLIHLLAPAALLLVAAEKDELIPLTAVRNAYERACSPKSLTVLPMTHFQVYYEPWLSRAIDEEVNWFTRYLA